LQFLPKFFLQEKMPVPFFLTFLAVLVQPAKTGQAAKAARPVANEGEADVKEYSIGSSRWPQA
jgi:hypothetical protein